MSTTSDISSAASASTTSSPYSVTANVNDGGVDVSSSTVNGSVPGTSGSTATATSGSATSANALGENDFMTLLVTQLQNQDPLNPTDDTQFISEMAQFSQLESSNNIEKSINDLNTSLKSSVDSQTASSSAMANTAAVSLIGKDVRMQVKNVDWTATSGEVAKIPVCIGGNDQATVEIKDSTGATVKTFTATGKDSNNTVNLEWDGTKDDGTPALAGTYTINIDGANTDNSMYAFVEDTVTGVRFSNNSAMLTIGGMELPLSQVLDVSSGSESSQDQTLSQSSAIELLGKDVRVLQNEVSFNQGTNETEAINVNATAGSSVQVNICDSTGATVKTLSGTAGTNGVASLTWDGSLDSGGTAPVGNYTFNIAGAASDPTLYGFVEGTVQGVTNLPGSTPSVQIAGKSYGIDAIVDISDPVTAAA